MTTLQSGKAGAITTSVYAATDIQNMLQISLREAYYLLETTTDYRTIRFGRYVRADRCTFDLWFNGNEAVSKNEVYTPTQIAVKLQISNRAASRLLNDTEHFRVLRFGRRIIRAHKHSFDRWFGSL